jgi:hypothetical protein
VEQPPPGGEDVFVPIAGGRVPVSGSLGKAAAPIKRGRLPKETTQPAAPCDYELQVALRRSAVRAALHDLVPAVAELSAAAAAATAAAKLAAAERSAARKAAKSPPPREPRPPRGA